jgi:CHASE2 domain-containing sensor protein
LRVKDTPARSDVVLIDLDRFSDGPNPSDSLARREHAIRALAETCRQKPKAVVVTIGLFELEGAARVFEKQKVDVLKSCPMMIAPSIIVDESKRPFVAPASPVKEYSKYLAGIGHDLVLADADGTTRRMFPWWDFGSGHKGSISLTASAFGARLYVASTRKTKIKLVFDWSHARSRFSVLHLCGSYAANCCY